MDDYTTDPIGTFRQNIRSRFQQMYDDSPLRKGVKALSGANDAVANKAQSAYEMLLAQLTMPQPTYGPTDPQASLKQRMVDYLARMSGK
jgi:hypothetical protein